MNADSTTHFALTYTIDRNDRIDAIDGEWESFADRNDAAQLSRDRVLGSSIWQFIEGIDTAEIHRLLFRRVRERELCVKLPFRCDGPRVRREMEMTVQPSVDAGVLIRTRVLLEQARPYAALLEGAVRRSNELIKVCSWCKKLQLLPGRWVEVEQAIREMRLLELPPIPRISHAMCEPCLAAFREQVEQGKQVKS